MSRFSTALGVALLLACAGAPSGPGRYRLADDGSGSAVLEELRPHYVAFFEVVLDSSKMDDLDLRALRQDLERQPVTHGNYDALNAVAIGYFVLNERAQSEGEHYLANSFRAAKLAAVPWSAYGRVNDGDLRDAILDFYQDIGAGEKPRAAQTAGRLASVVASLERKESNPGRLARIRGLSEALAAQSGRPLN